MHFNDPGFLFALFRLWPTLKKIFFTIIAPSEALEKLDSANPDLYTLVYPEDSTNFLYCLEDNKGDNYEQPYSGLRWLGTNSISCPGFPKLGVERLRSVYAHSLYVVTPQPNLRTTDLLPFPDVVRLPAFDPFVPHPCPWIPHTLWKQVVLHANALSKMTEEDSWAKIRANTSGPTFARFPLTSVHQIVKVMVALRELKIQMDMPIYRSPWTKLKLALFLWLFKRNWASFARWLFPKHWQYAKLRELQLLPIYKATLKLSNWFVPEIANLSLVDSGPGPFFTTGGPGGRSNDSDDGYLSQTHFPKADDPPPPPAPFVPEPVAEPLSQNRILTPAEVETLCRRLDCNTTNLVAALHALDQQHGDAQHNYILPERKPDGLYHRLAGDDALQSGQQPLARPAVRLDLVSPQSTIHPATDTSKYPNSVMLPITIPEGPRARIPMTTNDCLITALARATDIPALDIWNILCDNWPSSELLEASVNNKGLSTDQAHVICLELGISIQVCYPLGAPAQAPRHLGITGKPLATITWTPAYMQIPSHWSFAIFGPMEQRSWEPIPASFSRLFGAAPLAQSFDYLPFKKWTPCPKRARTFFKAWVARDVGVEAQRVLKNARLDPDQILTTLKDPRPPPSVDTVFIHGAAGCGKSYPIQETIKSWASDSTNRDVYLAGSYFCFFRIALLDDWKKKLGLPETHTFCLKTFENILSFEVEFLIIDEISQAPPGWLDFIMIWNQNLRRVIVLGDICQGQFVSGSKDPLPIDNLPSTAKSLLTVSTPYINFTRRTPQLLAQRLGLSTRSTEVGSITFGHALSPGTWQTLLPSTNDALNYSQLLQRPCYTYTSPQGKDWDNVQLVVTQAALVACSAESLWTAVTRCRKNLHICFAAPVNANFLGSHKFWGPLLGYHAPINNTNLFPELRNLQLMDDPIQRPVFGCKARTVGEVLSSWTFQRYDELPPSFRALMPLIQEPSQLEPKLLEPTMFEEPPCTHLPPGWDPVSACEAQPPRAREDRELFWKGLMGAQYEDTQGTRRARDQLEQIFPHQTAGRDPVLLPTAIEKRLRFSTEARNKDRFDKMSRLGPGIFERFRQRFGLPEKHEFDQELFLRCTAETEARKLEKPLATIWNNIDRSDPDWQRNHMSVFVKSQHKAKAETLAFRQRLDEMDDITLQAEFAKAGQTLVTSPDINVFELGPLARYMREVLKQTLPENVYLHGGKTINQFNDWSKDHATDEKTFTCDFTAYDQSCTEETLAFELAFMDYCGLPSELIELYTWIKLTMHTQYGTTAVMRFTGEFGTYDFNTFWNMAYMTLRYDPDPSIASCFSGDDSLFFGNLKETPSWPLISRHFTLVGKTAYSDIPEFCGWFMYSYGVVRNPVLLALKIAYRSARGELSDVLDSYFLEALFAHRHADLLYSTLPPLALEAQRWVLDYCFQHAPLVPHLSTVLSPIGFKRVPWLLLPPNLQTFFLTLGSNFSTSL
jgi:hypothetical protein